MACGDFLGLGHDQILVGWRGGKAEDPVGLKLFVPEDGGQWRSLLVDDGMACEDLEVADVDGDGRLDAVASGRRTRNVRLYLNARR